MKRGWIFTLAALGWLICIITTTTATYFDPTYQPFNKLLSDVGISEGISANLFNWGLIITGICLFPISFYLAALREMIAVVCWVISNISLVGLGIFTVSSAETLHEFCATGFFVTLYVAMSIITVRLIKVPRIRAYKISLVILLMLSLAYIFLDRRIVQAVIVFSAETWLALFIASISYHERKLPFQNS
ncbi:MAG: DUF998 domain-containing protein [bacterium]